VPPGHPSWIIAGTSVRMTGFSGGYEGPGLYRSEDSGRTWQIGTAGLTVRSLIPGQIAVPSAGTLLLGFGPHDSVGQMVVMVGTRDFLAVVLSSAGNQTVAHADRSSDDGRSWHAIGTLPGSAFDSHDPHRSVLAAVADPGRVRRGHATGEDCPVADRWAELGLRCL